MTSAAPPQPPPEYTPGYQQNAPPPGQPPQPAKKSHKLRWFFLIVAGFIALIVIISSVGTSTPTKTNAGGTKSTAPGVSKGLGSADASGDVKIGKPDASNGFSIDVPITVTNHSSKRSDYFVDLALVSADGKTQYDTTIATIQNLDPGQTSTDTASFLKVSKVPLGAKIVIKSIQRTASI